MVKKLLHAKLCKLVIIPNYVLLVNIVVCSWTTTTNVGAGRRPKAMKNNDAPFYLGIEYVSTTLSKGIWFRNQPMGLNKLNAIMKSMAKAAEYYHSARKSCVQRWLDAVRCPGSPLIQELSEVDIKTPLA